jgi:hypothetical protein
MRRLTSLLAALAAVPLLTGCCCWDWCCNPCGSACSPCGGGYGGTYGAPVGGAYYSPYGAPAVGAVPTPVSTAYLPVESLPTY